VEHERPVEVRVKRAGGSASLERTFRASGRLVLQVRTELIDFKSDSARTTLTVEYQRDTRDDYFDPQRGMLAYLSVEASAFPDLLKLTGEGRWYRRVSPRNVVALRTTGGVALHPGSVEALPNFERFFAGGANSVRGWSLNQLSPRDIRGLPVGGRSLLEGSLELRTRLLPFLGMALFLDAGNVGLGRFDAFDPDALRTSAGAGLRYLSPIGPMRLDFSSRISQDSYAPDYRVYFSLGQAF
ncbi:MAG: outer membrane protein assembly factor, partial [Candidatus Latescibacteria bacterium]|nr:outer membrane protein assembly factor [Candidatus Latescibacterota bacterium]